MVTDCKVVYAKGRESLGVPTATTAGSHVGQELQGFSDRNLLFVSEKDITTRRLGTIIRVSN
jgi:hypothetical protein